MTVASYDGIRFRREIVNGVGIHFQEAGDPARPTLLLLHGFPSTSRMWDRLIPSLLPHFHVIAPDYPGFGLSDAPPPDAFAYTFGKAWAHIRVLRVASQSSRAIRKMLSPHSSKVAARYGSMGIALLDA